MLDKLYIISPHRLQNFFISVFNFLAYRKRYGGKYVKFKKIFRKNRNLSRSELNKIQKSRFNDFITNSKLKSAFYADLYRDIDNPSEMNNIEQLPIINKEILRNKIKDIVIYSNENLITSKTGGTTGKSLEVKYLPENMQERFAMLDDFRSRFGYKLGKKTAWFSGKSLLNSRDLKKKRFWKTDYWYKVRYYSTFHIKQDYLKYYVEDLIKYKPEYMVGFPSTMMEIAQYGIKYDYDFPADTIKAIFPTAESITPLIREKIESFFKTKMYDQYASSEGAPFIFECKQGNLHLEVQSGVFEVLDENNKPTQSGRLVVTSFTTEATPLIRYDIGDSIILDDSEKFCTCGNNNPLVKQIDGRIDDYIYSPEMGKINLGNISNTLKGTKGIRSFQVIQNSLDSLEIYVITDEAVYNDKFESVFIKNWRDRVGNKILLEINYVKDIPVEKSGKFRIVKNNIKNLLSD